MLRLFARNLNTKVPPPQGGPKLRYVLGVALGGTIAFMGVAKYLEPNHPKLTTPPNDNKKENFNNGNIPNNTIITPQNAHVVFVLGGPGAGKGTQCEKLVNDYGFIHLSAGDLLRAEQNRPDSQYGDLISKCIKEGTIVPQDITIALLQRAMQDAIKNNNNGVVRFLVDGFPRKMDQAITFEEKIVPCRAVLFIDCPETVMLQRLLNRGKTSGRADDNIESIKKRFKTFTDTSMPVVNYFSLVDKVVSVSCVPPSDKVYQEVKQKLGPYLN